MSQWNLETDKPKESSIAFSIIIENIHEDHLDLIMDLTSSGAAWDKLKKKFAGKSVSQQRACIKSLVDFKMTTNMQANFNNLKALSRTLQAACGGSETIKIPDLVAIFALEYLPSDYNGEKAVLQSQDTVSLDEIEDKIVKGPLDLDSTKGTPSANVARSRGDQCQHNRLANSCWNCHPNLRPSCQKCKDLGRKSYHKTGSKYCFVESGANKTTVEACSCLVSSTVSGPSSSKGIWIHDSGCTNHMCRQKDLLHDLQSDSRQINTASSQVVNCEGKGNASVQGRSLVNVKDVLYSSGLSENLLSVSAMADKGHITLFDAHHSYVVETNPTVSALFQELSSHAFLQGTREGGLYKIESKTVTSAAHVTRSVPKSTPVSTLSNQKSRQTVSFSTWHRRLGHLNFADMRRLPKLVTVCG
jgi:hypothetical protein